jgi:hypothetical protein
MHLSHSAIPVFMWSSIMSESNLQMDRGVFDGSGDESDRQLIQDLQDWLDSQPEPELPAPTCGDCVHYFRSPSRDGHGFCPICSHTNEWGEAEIGKPIVAVDLACSKHEFACPF